MKDPSKREEDTQTETSSGEKNVNNQEITKDANCKDFLKKSSATRRKHQAFRIFPHIVNNNTLNLTWNWPKVVENETICGYSLMWFTQENKKNKYLENELSETWHTLTLNSSVDYFFYVDLYYYQNGLHILESTHLHKLKGWGNEKTIVGPFIEVDHTAVITTESVYFFLKKESIHPISSIAIFIIVLTMTTLVAVVMVSIFKCLSNRSGTPYIFNRPILNTHESLGRARNKVRKIRNIFRNGPGADSINFSSLVDQSDYDLTRI